MANELTFQTRIQSKIATAAEWAAVADSFKPLRGEVCIVEVPGNAPSNPSTLALPVYLIKVGNGTSFFKDLPYLAGRSADVANFLKVDSTGATWTQEKFQEWIKGLITIDDVDTSAFALDADLQQAIKDMEAEIERAKAAEAKALEDAKAYTDEKSGAMNTRVLALEAIDHDHANKAELDKIADGDKAKWDGMLQEAKNYADGLDDAMDERVLVLEGKFGTGEGTVESQISAAVEAEKQLREQADTGLSNRIKAIEDDHLTAADKTELTGAIATAKQEAIEAVLDGVTDDFDTLKEVALWIQNDTTSSAELVNRVSTIEGDYLKAADKTGLQNQINGLDGRMGTVEGAVATKAEQEALTGVSNRVTAVENELNTASTGLKARMTEAEGDIDDLEELVGSGKVDDRISAAINALKIGDYAKAADLLAAVNRIAANEGNITNLTTRMGTAEGEIDALQADIVKKANDADLAAIAKSGDIKDLAQASGYVVFCCGTSTTNV